ncbi:branched-chain amino acid ABC transporter permease [Bartonella henselae]|uniref:branched-chain amino acid ABC transporter permease n=1 Tax=Bartonella henselae TaxID=38323 RepID=UPI000963643D|nr:branched-chain amino acid ABC transporter permease [Bartonella henselae]OLL56837.1 branched-chain amino acid ABC transporter permease [Bartonella henselae]UJM33184.1 branched-chain amino acid ABC transporter permease [Bartonella henselae]
MSTEMFIQYFFNALALGALYGLIAIGYTMVYGILRLINFAHGDIFMLGAYFVFFSTISFMPAWAAVLLILLALFIYYSVFIGFKKRPEIYWVAVFFAFILTFIYYFKIAPQDFTPIWILALCFSIFITSAVGITIDQFAYKPLRHAPRISALIGAIGVSFFIENLATVIFSGVPKGVKQPDFLVTPFLWHLGSGENGIIRIAPMSLIVPIVSFILIVLLLWIIHKTKPGLAMRAISHDIETTRLMGVSVNKVIALTFGIGSALAAIAGIMWALRYPQVQPYMGILPGLKAFIAAVIGGIGSIPGAMLGGLLLGFIEIMIVAFFPALSGYRDAFAFILLILILLVMPTGLMGKKNQEKI